jgi:hypothetical protein
MTCFDSVDAIAACVKIAIDWFDLAKGAASLVSASAVTALLFVVGAWKRERRRAEVDIEALTDLIGDKNEIIKQLTEELEKYQDIALNISFNETLVNTIHTWHHPRFNKDAERGEVDIAKSNAGVPADVDLYAFFDFSTFWTSNYLVIGYNGIYWPGQTRLPWEEFASAIIVAAADELRIGTGPVLSTNGKIPPQIVARMLETLQTAIQPYFEDAKAAPAAETMLAK